MANWWKCKIVKPSMMIPFSTGEIIFAKNGENYITLFDGCEESQAPKAVLRYLQLVSRMNNPDSNRIQQDYEQKKGSPVPSAAGLKNPETVQRRMDLEPSF
jgi:hypothetical protein